MTDQSTDRPSVLDQLPGELMMWVLIVSELLVFGAGLAAFLAVRISDPAGFAEAQTHLLGPRAGCHTISAAIVIEDLLAVYTIRHIAQVQLMYRARLEKPCRYAARPTRGRTSRGIMACCYQGHTNLRFTACRREPA